MKWKHNLAIVASLSFATTSLVTEAAALHAGVRSVYSGPQADSTCAILADYQISCWGAGFFSPQPPASIGGRKVTSATLGNGFGCALLDDTTVWCWGDNSHGQLGDGTFTSKDNPVPVGHTVRGGSFDHVVSISAGDKHVCAKRSDVSVTTVWCWGSNSDGQLGNFNFSRGADSNTPVDVLIHDSASNPRLSNIDKVAVGGTHSCAELTDKSVACWGNDKWGQLGNNHDFSWFDSPQAVQVPSPIVLGAFTNLLIETGSLSSGGDHSCGLTDDSMGNAIACWGHNLDGQIGNGDSGNAGGFSDDAHSPVPDAVVFPDGAKLRGLYEIYGGGKSTCALLADLSAACWGYGKDGELGDADVSSEVSPYPVLSPTGGKFENFFQLVGGYAHFCAFDLDREVFCWGSNALGQLGVSGPTSSNVPQRVPVDATLFVDGFD